MQKRTGRTRRLATLLAASFLAAPLSAQAADSPAPPPLRTLPAKGSPNIVVILLDDVGFGATSTFGGAVPTPVLDALAKDGLRYNRFHTTAICSPTRASLLTGRNPHAVGMGAVMNSADARPGYHGFQTRDAVSVAELLRRAGYNTAAFGKWHQTPDFETSPNGPFDRWPTGQGFERFYGFIGGETDQFEPTLYEGTRLVPSPARPGYHLTTDLATQAAEWLRTQNALEPDRPAFLYFAPGGAHAPLQAPRDWIDRFKGRFDRGWDALRDEIVARQKRLGIIPRSTAVAPRAEGLPAWADLTREQQANAARLMEVYAGFLAHTDAEIARLIDALKANGEFDNTLILYVVGDNGASGEGGLMGSVNYVGAYQGMPESDALRTAQREKMGGPGTNTHFPSGWAWATNAPFPWMKTVASHLGGIRNGLVVTWPQRLAAEQRGGIRTQFGHVNDIMPTILEATGLSAPDVVDGIRQKPIDGTSLLYSLNAPKAAERHTVQYFEVFGNRALYADGWMASAHHGRKPWNVAQFSTRKFEDDTWELYDLSRDFAQARDLSGTFPEKLADLRARFDAEAERNGLLPLKNTTLGSGLPSLSKGVTRVTYGPGATAIPESALPRMVARSWQVEADVETGTGSEGVIAAVGGGAGGWSLFIRPDGTPALTYHLFNIQSVALGGASPLPPGRHRLTLDFVYDGGGFAKGATIRLLSDGTELGSARIPTSPSTGFTLDDPFSVGVDSGSHVGPYPEDRVAGFPFRNGQIHSVTISLTPPPNK